MKKKLLPMLPLLAAFVLVFFAEPAKQAVIRSISLCGAAILPSLFPFFLCTNFLSQPQNAEALSAPAGRFMRRVFHLPQQAALPWLLGFLGGYPTGAKMTAAAYKSGRLEREQAERLVLFCNNAGPAFTVGFVGGCVFDSVKIGLLLWLVHIVTGIFCGILLRPRVVPMDIPPQIASERQKPFASVFTEAVINAGQNALRVCAFVTAFSIPAAYLRLLPICAKFAAIPVGMLELTGGISLLSEASLSLAGKCTAASFLLGFGGIAVYGQSVSFLGELSSRKLPAAKLLHGLLSAALTWLIFCFLSPETGSKPTRFAEILLIILLLGIICAIFRKITAGNPKENRL